MPRCCRQWVGVGGSGMLEEIIKADNEDLMDRLQIESALGNKTMNDESKARLSYRGQVWGVVWRAGGAGSGERVTRKGNVQKRGASATKEKRKINVDVGDDDAFEGKRARLEQEELFLEQRGRKGTNGQEREGQMWAGGRRWRNWRISLDSRKKKGLMKKQDGSLFHQPLFSRGLILPRTVSDTHLHTCTHREGVVEPGAIRSGSVCSSVSSLFTRLVYS